MAFQDCCPTRNEMCEAMKWSRIFPGICSIWLSVLCTAHGNVPSDHENGDTIIVGDRFRVAKASIHHRDAGEIEGHPMIKVADSKVQDDDMGKFVGTAWDMHAKEEIFLKCTPVHGGFGTVEGFHHAWRGQEAEDGVRGERHVLTSHASVALRSGGTCRAYEMANCSLVEAMW
jgi:hypothetical protein